MLAKDLDKISSLKKKLPYVLIFVAVTLSVYWLKSNIGIDFFEEYTLSHIFPFNYLVPNKVIDDQPPGIILNDSFDYFSIFGNWTSLWMREEGKVTKGISPKGIDNSRCIVIKSSSTKSWSLSHKNIIKVNPGDVFSFQVATKIYGKSLLAQAGVAVYDKNMSVVSWNYFKESTDISSRWVLIERNFTIPDKISYIRFRLSGTGSGDFRFDDVSFKKTSFLRK